jgi:hypothetical protein
MVPNLPDLSLLSADNLRLYHEWVAHKLNENNRRHSALLDNVSTSAAASSSRTRPPISFRRDGPSELRQLVSIAALSNVEERHNRHTEAAATSATNKRRLEDSRASMQEAD